MSKQSILVAGAAGRMGKAIIAEILRTPDASLAGGFERAGAPDIGKDVGANAGCDGAGVVIEDSISAGLTRAGALIDFTVPVATLANAQAAADAGVAHIIGTTGFDDDQEAALLKAAEKTAIVKSGNMSLGVNMLAALVEDAARRLNEEFDIEVFEAHHRHKVDAPSGTALMLAEAAARGRGVDLNDKAAGLNGDRNGVRKAGDIGFSVLRGGGIIGDHHVSFSAMQETITISHQAIDRSLFARGAVAAAIWAQGKPPGLYSMRDVLGF